MIDIVTIKERTLLALSSWLLIFPCAFSQPTNPKEGKIIVGAEQLDVLLPRLQGKRVGLLVNNTSKVGETHLVDTLRNLRVNLKEIFSPEHGFRGNAADGELISNSEDTKTGLKITSLYGDNKKPTPEQLAEVDVVIYDIQDVGARFYTYISSLHYMMEACAEQGKKLIVLDRPNPNAGYIDGPILRPELKSFVGMHPLPIVYGMTVGELAQMINGEGWLQTGKKCDLEIIPLRNYTHQKSYALPVKPSPNLPNDHAVALYPSICLFEGTVISLGRGTTSPFEVVGNPELKGQPFQFTPITIQGMSKNPPYENKICYGLDLRNEKTENKISLRYLIYMYQHYPDKGKFFTPYFAKLAGTPELEEQIKKGFTEEQIRVTWQKDLDTYKIKRSKYLLYP
jgi:uncharacterized protein YbbC (DUF1343 family)